MKAAGRTSLLTILAFLQFVALSTGAFAGTFRAFGPKVFQRSSGDPQTTTVTFTVLNPTTQYTLHLQNSGVSSAVVSINGKQILGEADFKPGVITIDRPVILLATNRIDVTVKGKLGSSFQLSIIGVDNDAPIVTASASPAPNGFNWNNTNLLVTFKCSDATSGVAICPSPVTVSAEGAGQVVSGTAVDNAGNKATASITLNIDKTQPTLAASAAPAANSSNWNNTNVTVSFLCADALSGVASCAGPVIFTNEGANQIASGTAVDKAGNTATASATVNIDKTAPVITVATPASNSTVSTPTLQITGSVTDALSGVASISCNSIAALLQGGSFSCSVTLAAGLNTVNVSATDVAGNTSTSALSVTLSNAQPVITDFSPKSGPVGTLVTLTGSNLTNTGNTTQIALNQQGGGSISAPISTATGTTIAFVIPAGAATGPITVTASGQSATSAASLQVTAASSFTITAGPAAATLLQGKTAAYSVSLDSADGFSQLAKLSVSGVPAGVIANFAPSQITAGQISILTVSAPVTQPTGSSTLTVSAAATVDGIPSTQTANVSLSVQPVTTSFFGRVVESDTIESPLPGIVITFLGVDDAAHPTGCSGRTVADGAGNFIFTNLPDACTGRQLVQYNGLTATDGEAYAGVNLAYTLIKGEATGPELVHLPRIDNAETVMVQQNAPGDQTFSFKTMPGISVTVYSGTIFTLPDGTQPDPFPFTGVEVPVDRLPDAPVDGPGTLRAFIVAFQPADTNSNQPVAVSFPNFINTPPGVNMELDTLDPVVGDLVKYGTGTVSGDGTQVVPDLDPAHPGHRFGIQHFDWHGPMSPAPNDTNPSPDSNDPDAGDPVDPASGIFMLRKTDIAFGGARASIAITRTYRTLAGTPGPFGVGTGHNYSYQLNTFGFIQGQGVITLIMPDGNQFNFIQQPDGTFINTTVSSLKGSVLTASSSQFVIRHKDGTSFLFQNPPTGARVAYLSSIKDRNGNVTTIARDNSNDPVQITRILDPVGRQLALTYDTFDRITSIADPIGRIVSYTYNDQGTLASVTDPNGGVTRYTYDSQNRMVSVVDPRGATYLQNSYDGNGKVISQTAADGGVTRFAYTLLNPNASVTIGANATTINTSPVLLTVVTDPLGHQITYHFNPQGYLVDTTDALGRKTVYTLAPGTNLLASVIDPLGRTTSFTYDGKGNITSSTSLDGTANALTTTFAYEPVFNRLTSITNPLQQTTRMQYDPHGNLTSITDPLNHQVQFTYDGFGEMLSGADALGNTTHFEYVNGDVTAIVDPLGNRTIQLYDSVDRMVGVTTPLGTSIRRTYDALDQLKTMINPASGVTSFAYDANGNLTQVSDPLGRGTHYAYNAMNQLISITDPAGRNLLYQYDLGGNLVEATDRRGNVTQFSYDELNRIVLTAFGVVGQNAESSITRTYDSVNRLTSAIDTKGGHIQRTYDGFDRLQSESTELGTVTYSYDANGRKTSVQVAGQSPVNYQYDAKSRLTLVEQAGATTTFAYDNADRRTSLTLPNGVITTYGYDQNSRLISLLYRHGTTVLGDLNYAYDAFGQRMGTTGSLARIVMPDAIDTATYDSSNRLTNWNGTPLQYDEDGNMISDGTNQLSWNVRGQLVGVNGAQARYDALGRRNVTFQGSSLLYDGTNAIQQTSASGSVSRVNGKVDEFFSQTDSSGMFFPLADILGNTIALTDNSGNLNTSYSYGAFGQTVSAGTANTNTYQFTGRENDGTGLYYLRARYYSPAFNRFISEDPMRFKGGSNFYAYANNNPISFNDPFGLSGTITIYSNNTGFFGNHSWISYTPDGGNTTTYGTWGNNPQGLGNGLQTNLEQGRTDASASRTEHLDDAAEAQLMNLIQQYKDKGADAWKIGSPCSTFAADAWHSGTGETLNTRWGPISNPSTLTNSIISANGGQSNVIVQQQPNGSSSSSRSYGSNSSPSSSSSGSSLNSSGSSLQ